MKKKYSLSVVLLAYNEEKTLIEAIKEIRTFCLLNTREYEIIVINDGSTDNTLTLLNSINETDIKVIHHLENMGMGASLRDGYKEARMQLATFLPADRQVRASTLKEGLDIIDNDSIVVSDYFNPHSGLFRYIMSLSFRLLLRHIANLKVNFEGWYIFPTKYFQDANPPAHLSSHTFVYSFQLLDAIYKAGCKIKRVKIPVFKREFGKSKVANFCRVAKISKELIKHRVPIRLERKKNQKL